MRIRSHLVWLRAASLTLVLVACADDPKDPDGPPECEELCDAALSGGDAEPEAEDGGGGGEADAATAQPDSDVPVECDCGTADGGSESDGQTGPDQDGQVASSCTDGAQNGDETGVDCGGACSPCVPDPECSTSEDCDPGLACSSSMMCVTGPTAGFTLAATTGPMPFNAVATSTATAGDSELATTEYNWGDGPNAAYEASATHRYREAGTYSVRQRVTDANGVSAESAPRSIVVSDYAVRFSATDKTAQIALTNNRLDVGIVSDEGGVRSDASIASGSGVFYFEAKQLFAGRATARFGLGTAAAPLTAPLGEGGSPSLGVNVFGVQNGLAPACNGGLDNQTEIGVVVDYRAANPRVHFITDNAGAPRVARSCTMPGITAPLFIMYRGPRDHIGPALRINTGFDTVNHPFHFATAGVRAALNAAGEAAAATALVPGFGKTRAGAPDAPPAVNVVASATTVAVGTPVTLTATATDLVDGNLTAEVRWTDVSSQFWSRSKLGIGVGRGATYTFTPDRIGRYPIEASVRDSAEHTTTTRVMITVTGTLASFNPVRLVHDALSDPACQISADGLSANFVTGGKSGVRANQGLYGQFWYFEAHRNTAAPEDLGVGLIIKGGNLIHYSFEEVPWSSSLNMAAGIWRNLIPFAGYPTAANHYGFAVDYRGTHPIVWVIVNNEVMTKMVMDDVWEPIYPMVYGNNNASTVSPDVTTDFTAPFAYNPAAALVTFGETPASVAGLELGWGI